MACPTTVVVVPFFLVLLWLRCVFQSPPQRRNSHEKAGVAQPEGRRGPRGPKGVTLGRRQSLERRPAREGERGLGGGCRPREYTRSHVFFASASDVCVVPSSDPDESALSRPPALCFLLSALSSVPGRIFFEYASPLPPLRGLRGGTMIYPIRLVPWIRPPIVRDRLVSCLGML